MWSNTFQSICTDTSNSNLISCSHEESSKCCTKGNFSSAGQSFCYTDQILFSNKTLNEAFLELFFQSDWKSWVFGIAIKCNNIWIWLSGLNQSVSIRFSGWNDLSNFVIWINCDSSFLNFRFFSLRSECFEFDLFMFNERFEVTDDFFSSLSQSFSMPVLLVLYFGEILTL